MGIASFIARKLHLDGAGIRAAALEAGARTEETLRGFSMLDDRQETAWLRHCARTQERLAMQFFRAAGRHGDHARLLCARSAELLKEADDYRDIIARKHGAASLYADQEAGTQFMRAGLESKRALWAPKKKPQGILAETLNELSTHWHLETARREDAALDKTLDDIQKEKLKDELRFLARKPLVAAKVEAGVFADVYLSSLRRAPK